MPTPYRIRRIGTERRHLKLLDWLDAECFPGDELEDKSDSDWWVAWLEDKPVAFAGLRGSFLCRVGVLPDHRGHGLQKKLIRVRLKELKRRGNKIALTYVHPANPASANSLISCGFRIYDPEWRWGLENAIYFYLNLKG